MEFGWDEKLVGWEEDKGYMRLLKIKLIKIEVNRLIFSVIEIWIEKGKFGGDYF